MLAQQKQIKPRDEAGIFVGLLMEEAGLGILPPESQQKVFADLKTRLDAKITLALLMALPDKKAGAFKELILNKKTTISQMNKFFEANIKNVEDVCAKAISEFRRLYLEGK